MRGYRHPVKPFSSEMVSEQILVGCKRCNNLWHETRMMLKDGMRINGPYYDYDYCDKCINSEEMKDRDFEKQWDEFTELVCKNIKGK